MPDIDPPVPDPRPGLPDVSGYVRFPEMVKILVAAAMTGGLSAEGIVMALNSLSTNIDAWYIGPSADTVKILVSSLVTIIVGLMAARRIARAGIPPAQFKRIEDKNTDDRY